MSYYKNIQYSNINCSIKNIITKDFITEDTEYKIRISKSKILDSDRYTYFITIYDNNFSGFRQNNKTKDGIYMQFELYEKDFIKFIDYMTQVLQFNINQKFQIERKSVGEYNNFNFNTYNFDIKPIQFTPLKCPIIYNIYYCVTVSKFISSSIHSKEKKYIRKNIYKRTEPKLDNELHIIFSPTYFNLFIELTKYVSSIVQQTIAE